MKKPTWSRREFLEVSAAAAGISAVGQPLKFRRLAPSDTVRFGMVGIGMQGSGLLGTSVSLPGVTCTAADGEAMVDAVKKSGRILQVGSQRVSSQICAKAKDMIAQGMLGDLTLVEGWLGRNDPCGAWEYPPPPDLSLQTLDWDTWQNDVPRRPLDPNIFARWRCWKEYGTGVAGDLLVHLISGMMFMLGTNEPPKQAAAVGGIRRWKDGRNMPDVHPPRFSYGHPPANLRRNLGTPTP